MKRHKFVIADYKRCIGCATCMAACFRSAYERGKLSKARLTVLRQAKGVMPTQCRQCDDGPCANVCPTGALRFDDNYIELHEEICIGCKLCTIACPYGAISSSAELMPSVNYAVEPKYYLEIESQAGAKKPRSNAICASGAKTALRASRFARPALSSWSILCTAITSSATRSSRRQLRLSSIKFYAEAKFKRASRFSRYRRGTWMQRPTLSLLASLKNSQRASKRASGVKFARYERRK